MTGPRSDFPAGAATLLAATLSIGCATSAMSATSAASARAAASATSAAALRIADADLDRDPRAVSGAEAALDLDVAVRAFDEAYAGAGDADRLPPAHTIDATRARLQARARWTPEEIVAALASLFAAPHGAPDGHLAFGYEGLTPLRARVWIDHRLDAPIAPSAPPGPAVELVARAGAGAVPRLTIRTFDPAAAPALDMLPAIARRLRALPAFIVDLRGNPGGDFRYGERFVLELSNAPLRLLDEREVISSAAAAGRANSVRARIARGEVPASALPAFHAQLAAIDATLSEAPPAGRSERIARGRIARGRAPGPLRGRAVFLVDRGCASACEMVIALARQIPGVVVAGSRTRGSMAVGELALFRLPRSGVTVRLGTRAFDDPLGDFREIEGFSPDVRAGADPLGDAERLALGRPAAPPTHLTQR